MTERVWLNAKTPHVTLWLQLDYNVSELTRSVLKGRRMKRSLGLQCLCIVAVVSAIAPWVGADDRPNFVIFVADDMAWDDCGAYGHPAIRTPAIDRLAAEGMRFDLAFLTCSSCSPSRCSMLTGRYPHSTGAGELHQPLPANQVLVSTPLREAGYFTAVAGKWHLGKDSLEKFGGQN